MTPHDKDDRSHDFITAAPSSHPGATGTAAATGGLVGAAVGMVGGPVGSVLGAVIGAVVGGVAGNAVAEAYDPTDDDTYWRDAYRHEPYYRSGYTYDDYAPAYGLGLGSLVADQYRKRPYDEIEAELAREWDTHRGNSRLTWEEASQAARAAWTRARRDHRTAY